MLINRQRRNLLAVISSLPALSLSAFIRVTPSISVGAAIAYLNREVFKSPHQRMRDF